MLGVLITLAPPATDDSGGGMSAMLRMLRGGGGGSDGTFLLPAKSVKRVVAQSVAKAKELEEMNKDSGEAEPAEEAPAEEKPAGEGM